MGHKFFIERELRWFDDSQLKQEGTGEYDKEPPKKKAPNDEPLNLVVSKIKNSNYHAPAIDIDVPCTLIESKTPNHYHLYIDKAVTWEDYLELLNAMVKCGIVEEGYVGASKAKEMTCLRRAPLHAGDENMAKLIRRNIAEGKDLLEGAGDAVVFGPQHPKDWYKGPEQFVPDLCEKTGNQVVYLSKSDVIEMLHAHSIKRTDLAVQTLMTTCYCEFCERDFDPKAEIEARIF